MARLMIIVLCCCATSFFTMQVNTLQTSKKSPYCPAGGKEAEEIHLLARKYREGAKGMPKNPTKAEELFEQALDMGNARSAVQISSMIDITKKRTVRRREWGIYYPFLAGDILAPTGRVSN